MIQSAASRIAVSTIPVSSTNIEGINMIVSPLASMLPHRFCFSHVSRSARTGIDIRAPGAFQNFGQRLVSALVQSKRNAIKESF
jgi:hypothetical protein